jgi:hypothetical protein
VGGSECLGECVGECVDVRASMAGCVDGFGVLVCMRGYVNHCMGGRMREVYGRDDVQWGGAVGEHCSQGR